MSKATTDTNRIDFKDIIKRCRDATASSILLIPILAQYTGKEFKETTDGRIEPADKIDRKCKPFFDRK